MDGFLGYVDTTEVDKNDNNTQKVQPRTDAISWDEFFMGVAELAAKRSKDPSTQVGCCIVDDDNKIVSVGYNGMPQRREKLYKDDKAYGGVIAVPAIATLYTPANNDVMYPWEREGDPEDVKYSYIVHAELNAILNAGGRSLKDTTMYVTLCCCNECAKAIVQAGIKKVIYKESRTDKIFKIADRIFDTSGVLTVRYNGK